MNVGDEMNQKNTQPEEKKSTPRDWFGYVLTGVIGIVVTIAATWYQLNVSDRQTTAAELERAKAVRQSVIAIVEEQALSGKKLEPQRLNRLVEQRRREQNVMTVAATSDVVEQAEFNISSSPYLSVDRKEEIKPIFDAFYLEMAARSFQVFPPETPNSDLLNELAKQIQEGKSTAALATLKRVQEIQSEALLQLKKKARPTVFDALMEFFGRPLNIALFVLTYLLLLFVAAKYRKSLLFRRALISRHLG
jgi:hypothetical protein